MAKPLSPKAQRMALALASGQTIAEWATATGTPLRTAQHWASRREFQDLVDEHQAQVVSTAVRKLAAGMTRAAERLLALVDSQDERIGLRAAIAVAERYEQLHMFADLMKRIEQLEERAAHERHHP